MLPLAFIGVLLMAAGAIMIWSPLWIAEQNKRNLDRVWGPGNFVSRSLDAQKDRLQVYRRLGIFIVAFGALWTTLVIVAMLVGAAPPS